MSPMRRTLQTARIGLQWLIKRGVPVQPRGEWQENSDSPCDTGTTIRTIAIEFPEFSFSTVFPEYPTKSGRWAFTKEAVLHRAIECRRWLKSRPEKVIAVVSHSAFLRLGVTQSQFSNADYRVFEFADNSDTHELVEWKLTAENGGGMGWSPKGQSQIQPSDFGTVSSQVEHDKGDKAGLEEVRAEVPAT